jgi:hypothetical protein
MTVTVSVLALATLKNVTHVGTILYYVILTKLTKSNKLCRFEQGLYLQVFLLNMCKIAHDSACLDYLEQCDKLINRHNCVTSPKAANSSKKELFQCKYWLSKKDKDFLKFTSTFCLKLLFCDLDNAKNKQTKKFISFYSF